MVDCNGLENRRPARAREFESHRFRRVRNVVHGTWYNAMSVPDVPCRESSMKHIGARDLFLGILIAAGLIGIALIGVAFGHSLRVGRLWSISQHPLFGAGVQCLTSSVVCCFLFLGAGRR